MKRILILLFLSLCLAGCEYMAINPEIQTLQDILYQVQKIKYVRDIESHNFPEYWQSPKETEELGTGDCEDMAFYFAYLAYETLGWECDLVAVFNPKLGFHMFAEYEGIIYDQGHTYSVDSLVKDNQEVIRYKYHTAMIMATLGYTKNIRGQ